MCLAIPAKILSLNGTSAMIDLAGTQREASVMLLEDAAVGDWILLHAGFAIEKITEEDAQQTLELLRSIAWEDEVR
ncbi:MAG: HypC/HybG/HupF family hydrogenase formation chaperone [Syntrophorhabdaceae bacterium]|nr:HypC/HybG/HupF family hydrogenase formation chaperone [Syntrophorhabdaceae bacterium]